MPSTRTGNAEPRRGRNPRILVLAYGFPASSETFIVDHVRGLLDRGATVTVAAWAIASEALTGIEQRYGLQIPVVRIPNRRIPGFPRLSRAIGSMRVGPGNLTTWVRSPDLRDAAVSAPEVGVVIRQSHPDLIHAHFGPLGIAAALATKQWSTPILVNFHGFDATVVPHRSGWSTYRPLARPGIRLIAHSRFIAERLAPLGLPVEQVRMGYDAHIFRPMERGTPRWHEPLRLIQVGRLVGQKGQRVALEAMVLLRDRGIEARLRLIGDGPEGEFLRQYCSLLDLQDHVEFLGALVPDDVAQKLRESDILLAPSLAAQNGSEEGFGRAVIEGVACGLPAVVFPTGGLAETVGVAGTVCSGTSASHLANGITATVAAGDRRFWTKRCLSVSRGRDLAAMWADYDRVTCEALAAFAG